MKNTTTIGKVSEQEAVPSRQANGVLTSVAKLTPITTKYSGPTNFRGARIGVKDVNNTRREISWSHNEEPPLENHLSAAYTFSSFTESSLAFKEMCVGYIEHDDGFTFMFNTHIEILKAPKKSPSMTPSAIRKREMREKRKSRTH